MSKSVEIVKTPDVLGGKPRIEGERIGVHTIGAMVRRGDFHIEDVVSEDHYQFLSEEQVEAALAYYDDHPEEMAAIRAENEAAIEHLRENSRAPDTDA